MEDQTIIAMLNDRSEDAVGAMQEKYAHYLHAIAARILPSAQDCEECVNDTYLRAWDSIPPQMPQILGAFLGRITRNLSLDRLRRQSAGKRGGGQYDLALEELAECIPADMTVEQALEQKRMSQVINDYLHTLPLENQMIFVGRYWHFRSIAELSRDFLMTQSRVKSILFRARNGLREILELEGISL